MEREKGETAPDTYSVEVECSNCNFKDTIKIMKGILISGERCPNCGCKTLERTLTSISS